MNNYSCSFNTLLGGLGQPELANAPEINGMTLDSRSVRPGDLFVALAGARCHGLKYLGEAIRRGCAAVLWEQDRSTPGEVLSDRPDLPQAGVSKLAERLGEVASRFYRQPSVEMKVIGVTGTNGKSSCVHLFGQASNGLGNLCGTMGTLGWGLPDQQHDSSHTTPDAIRVHAHLAAMRDAGAGTVAMEVSSHALDQGRVNGVKFDTAILTNLTHDHLDYHGDMEAYGQTKARLFASEGLRFAILNREDELGRKLLAELGEGVETISYGISGAQVSARKIRQSKAGLQFVLHSPWGQAQIDARLLGRFNIENLLAVAATLGVMGWSMANISRSFAKLVPVPGRMNLLGGTSQPLVVVDYAHTPDALKQSLLAVREHCTGHLICLFGCGGDRDRSKRAPMAAVAEQLADQVMLTDDNPRTEDGNQIVADILAGFEQPEAIQVVRDRAKAIAQAVSEAGSTDVVLVAGKGHETYQEVEGVRRHFDDRELAGTALEAWS